MNTTIAKNVDLRGVACPMNYVRVLEALADIEQGRSLALTIDDEKALIQLPRSAKEDGHRILDISHHDGEYRVVIRKGGPG